MNDFTNAIPCVGHGFEEKGSDVNLASHLVRDTFRKQFEVAVLITNDSDLAEPVRIVISRTAHAGWYP